MAQLTLSRPGPQPGLIGGWAGISGNALPTKSTGVQAGQTCPQLLRQAHTNTPMTTTENQPPASQPFRVVLVDDEPWFTEMVELAIATKFKQVTVRTYHHRDEAWVELCRAAPDLLITDMRSDNVPGRSEYLGMSGWKLLPLLVSRRAKYPILVMSGSAEEKEVRDCAGPSLNFSFLKKPFTLDRLWEVLSRYVLPAPHPG